MELFFNYILSICQTHMSCKTKCEILEYLNDISIFIEIKHQSLKINSNVLNEIKINKT